MICPLDLNLEEREIYTLLYKKMNFETFETKYTLQQLSDDSDSRLNITKKKVNNIINKFIKNGYIQVIFKGTKGNPTIYKIFKASEVNGTNRERIGNELGTNRERINEAITLFDIHEGNELGTNRERIRNTKVPPIKEKEKEKDIYNNIFDFYISLGLIKHKKLTKGIKKAIDLAIKQYRYTEEEMKTLLTRHKQKVEYDKDRDSNYKIKTRTLEEFFGQKIQGSTALICTQYEEGGKYFIETPKPQEKALQTPNNTTFNDDIDFNY